MADEWQVRVDRGYRGEFAAYTGPDEQEARSQFAEWQEDKNVDRVSLYVNGNLSQPLYQKRKPGRPVERWGDYERITLEIRSDLLAKIDASGKSRREYIEELLKK